MGTELDPALEKYLARIRRELSPIPDEPLQSVPPKGQLLNWSVEVLENAGFDDLVRPLRRSTHAP